MNNKNPVFPYVVAVSCISFLYYKTNLAVSWAGSISNTIHIPREVADFILFVLLQVIPFLILTKRAILAGMPCHYLYKPINNNEDLIQFVELGLNRKTLASYSSALENLGFVHLGDFQLQDEKIKIAPSFGRLFLNHELNCFIEINQIFSPNKSKSLMAMRYVIVSLFVDDWSLASSNSKISRLLRAIIYLYRSPRNLWMSYSHTILRELLQLHLKNRHKIAKTLGLRVKTNLDADSFIHWEQESARQRYQILRHKNVFVLFWELLSCWLFPKSEWLGDYGKIKTKTRG